MKRNAIIRLCAQIEDAAKLASYQAADPLVPKWAGLQGEAQRLSNMACEAQHTLKYLRNQLRDLRDRFNALKGAQG